MTLGTHAYLQVIARLRLAERSPPHVRRIAQSAPYHTAVPVRLSRRRHRTRLGEATYHFPYAQAVHPHPLEDRPDRRCLGQFDNVPSRRAVELPANVAVAVERPGQYIDAAAFCAVKLATAVTLGDLRPLVFRVLERTAKCRGSFVYWRGFRRMSRTIEVGPRPLNKKSFVLNRSAGGRFYWH